MRRALLSVLIACLIYAQKPDDGQIQKFAAGYEFVSALAWSPKDSFLLIADGPAGIVRRVDPKGTTKWREGLHVSGIAVDEKNAVYATDAREGRVLRISGKGKVDVLAASFEGKKFNGPADIVVAKNGHIWFADPAFGSADTRRALPFYGIYHLTPKSELAVVAKLHSRPNGLALAPDGKTLYASVADDRTVLAWTVGRDGETTGERVFAKGIDGVPAGLTTSADGRIWVCARAVVVFSPDGDRLSSIPLAEKPKDCEFGEDGKTLFIAAGTSVYRWTAEKGVDHKQSQQP